ncbi:hypothetical protein K1719_038336 [Acacia pycnantha]|nr:hypothetical protein K1719_038336 [Acacia pycnantha]
MEAKGKEREELEEVYNNLERDWNAYKQSKSRTRRTCSTNSGITVKAVQLIHNSPRHLMSQLQGSTVEIAGDGSKFKGRRIFEAMDDAGEDDMGQVIRSLSFSDSEDEGNGCKGQLHSSSSSSSSSPIFSGEEEAKVEGVKGSVCVVTDAARKRKINGGRYIVMLGGFSIALLIFAIFLRSATSYGGFEGILVPT